MNEDITGKTIIVTGANSGIGYEAAKFFSKHGAKVILAVRNLEKGELAITNILKENKNANVTAMKLDLADLRSVHDFVAAFKEHNSELHILVNNAGVMVPPYEKTVDGFELQFGSNHLGHFALTGLLLPLLKQTPASRVVTLSSIAHRQGKINFDNLDGANGYKAMKFYSQSKLANLLFAKELDDRLKEHGIGTISIACHPGITSTNLFKFGKKESSSMIKKLLQLLFQNAEMGALPTIYAATNPSLKGGEYIGPDGRGNRTGYPTIETPKPTVYDEATMKKLWDVSEKLTGIVYQF